MNKDNKLFIEKVSKYFQEVYHFVPDVADFIGCQFALESFYGSSSLCIDYNNFIGMKTPFCRISTCNNLADTKSIWAHYNHLYDCCDDYALWLQFQKPLRKVLDDVSLFPSLLRTYCPEKDYISKIQSIYQQFKILKK